MQILPALTGLLAACPLLCLAQDRVPWEDSEVHGSPEPPPPFVAATVFPTLALKNALELATAPGSERFFVVEREGRIFSFVPEAGAEDPQLVVNLKEQVPQMQNAYSIAFHPEWRKNRRVFVTYTLKPGLEDGSRLSRFELRQLDPPEIDPASETILLTWLSGGHNGAHLQFGPDRYLYLTTGDGEVPTPPDPRNTGQDLSDLLSSVLRLDIDHEDEAKGYSVPDDNPFLDVPNARPEIWSYGLRNPWKISFGPDDRLWCGDVGWELWEMIHLIDRGSNHGWSTLEASQPVRHDTPPSPSPISPPVIAHPHTEAASITGGYVYTGQRHPDLEGAYVYGDYETGKIWALWHDGTQVTKHLEIADTPHKIVSFGRAPDGELFYLHFDAVGSMHELVPNPAAGRSSTFPSTLSETGLFSDHRQQTPAQGVYEFDVREPMWQDGATARRFIGLPGTSTVATKVNRRPNGSVISVEQAWPEDSVLAKTISGSGDPPRPIETQILHFDGATWSGYTYRWREDGSDADLVGAGGERAAVALGSANTLVDWRFHARAECDRCHTVRSGITLGFQPEQLSRILVRPEPSDTDPVVTLKKLRLVDEAFGEKRPPNEQDPSVESRARDWLHINCAHCHRQAAGGSAAIRLDHAQTVEKMALVGERPIRGELGIPDAQLIAPGLPWRSVLINRIARSGAGHMPIIGPQEVDVRGLKILWEWVAQMPADPSALSTVHHDEDQRDAELLAALQSTGPGAAEAATTLLSHVPGALRVIHAMEQTPLPKETQETVTALGLGSSHADVRALFDRFRPATERMAAVGSSPDPAEIFSLEGRVEEGRTLLTVTGKMAVCLGCHVVRGEGRNIGPELSQVGARLTPAQLFESLVQPSKTISPGYTTVTIGTHTGFILGETEDKRTLRSISGETLTLTDADGPVTRLPISLMPEGLIQSLTPQEVADLITYLSSLK